MVSGLRRLTARLLIAVPRAAWRLDWYAGHRRRINRAARAVNRLTRPALRLDETEAYREMHKAGWWG